MIQYNVPDGSREEKIHISVSSYTLKRIKNKTIIKLDSDHDFFSPFYLWVIVKLPVSRAISYKKSQGEK